MATITFRTDAELDRALAELTEDGESRSEIIRAAILAAYRDRHHAKLRAEAEALRNDPDEVAAAKRLADEMGEISAW